MNIIHSLMTVRTLVVVFVVISVVWVVSMFYTSNEVQAPLSEIHKQSAGDESTQQVNASSPSFTTNPVIDSAGEDKTPVFVNLNPSTYNLEDYADPDEVLIQLGQVEIPPEQQGSIGEYIDPEDDNYTYMELTPGSIGEVVDPNDESYVLEISSSGNIGEIIDPNDESIELEITNPGNIGEVVDPNEIY